MKRKYAAPGIVSQKSFETSALACGKTTDPPPGSYHFTWAYDTFTGHWASGLGGSESVSGSVALGWGHGGTSGSYPYTGLCSNWCTYNS